VSETARRGEGESRALGAAAWATGTTAASKPKRWTVVLRRSGRCEVRRGGRQAGRAPAERVIMPAPSQNGDDYGGRDIALLAGLQMAALRACKATWTQACSVRAGRRISARIAFAVAAGLMLLQRACEHFHRVKGRLPGGYPCLACLTCLACLFLAEHVPTPTRVLAGHAPPGYAPA
jgi:hypothetical protein